MRAAAYVKVFLFLEPDPKEPLLVAPEKVLLNSSDCDCGCAFDTRDLLKPRDLDSSCFLNMLMSVCLNDQTSVQSLLRAAAQYCMYHPSTRVDGRCYLWSLSVLPACTVMWTCHATPSREDRPMVDVRKQNDSGGDIPRIRDIPRGMGWRSARLRGGPMVRKEGGEGTIDAGRR